MTDVGVGTIETDDPLVLISKIKKLKQDYETFEKDWKERDNKVSAHILSLMQMDCGVQEMNTNFIDGSDNNLMVLTSDDNPNPNRRSSRGSSAFPFSIPSPRSNRKNVNMQFIWTNARKHDLFRKYVHSLSKTKTQYMVLFLKENPGLTQKELQCKAKELRKAFNENRVRSWLTQPTEAELRYLSKTLKSITSQTTHKTVYGFVTTVEKLGTHATPLQIWEGMNSPEGLPLDLVELALDWYRLVKQKPNPTIPTRRNTIMIHDVLEPYSDDDRRLSEMFKDEVSEHKDPPLMKRWKWLDPNDCLFYVDKLQGEDMLELWQKWCPDPHGFVDWSPNKSTNLCKNSPSDEAYFPVVIHCISQPCINWISGCNVPLNPQKKPWMVMSPPIDYLPSRVVNVIAGEKGLLCLDGGEQPSGLNERRPSLGKANFQHVCWNDRIHHVQSMTVVCNPLRKVWHLLPPITDHIQDSKAARLVVTNCGDTHQRYKIYCVGGDTKGGAKIGERRREGCVVTVYDSKIQNYCDKQEIWDIVWPVDNNTVGYLDESLFWGAMDPHDPLGIDDHGKVIKHMVCTYYKTGPTSHKIKRLHVDIPGRYGKLPWNIAKKDMESLRVLDCDASLYAVSRLLNEDSADGAVPMPSFHIFNLVQQDANTIVCTHMATSPAQMLDHILNGTTMSDDVPYSCSASLGRICIFYNKQMGGLLYDVASKRWEELPPLNMKGMGPDSFVSLANCVWEPSFSMRVSKDEAIERSNLPTPGELLMSKPFA